MNRRSQIAWPGTLGPDPRTLTPVDTTNYYLRENGQHILRQDGSSLIREADLSGGA